MKKRMYIGPTFDGIAARNTVYESLPEALEAAIQKRPWLSGLCVPIQALPKAFQQLENRQGGVYTLYAKAESEREIGRAHV